MRGTAIETLAVATLQDRPVATLTDGQVDRARRSRHERNGRGLVAFADDAQRPMSSLEPEILDVGGACFAHAQSVETKQHRQRRVVVVVLLRREQEHTELRAVQPACICRVHLGPTNIVRRVEPILPSM
jgi:hypothetical protein